MQLAHCKQIINLSNNEKRRDRWTHVQRPLISLNCSSDYLTESAATVSTAMLSTGINRSLLSLVTT